MKGRKKEEEARESEVKKLGGKRRRKEKVDVGGRGTVKVVTVYTVTFEKLNEGITNGRKEVFSIVQQSEKKNVQYKMVQTITICIFNCHSHFHL